MIDFRRGWDESVKFFLQTPYLGEEPNQLSEHTTIRTIELSIVNDDSALAHDFVDFTLSSSCYPVVVYENMLSNVRIAADFNDDFPF